MCYEFTHGYCPITGSGFPHSEISGSKLTYSSPEHIGVSAVLLRLLVPRHPPCALSNLTVKKSITRVICHFMNRLFVSCFNVVLSSFQRASGLKEPKKALPPEGEPSKLNAKRQHKIRRSCFRINP